MLRIAQTDTSTVQNPYHRQTLLQRVTVTITTNTRLYRRSGSATGTEKVSEQVPLLVDAMLDSRKRSIGYVKAIWLSRKQ